MDQGDQTTVPETLVRVLGPVSATVRGRPCLISSPMQRAVLSLLAVDAGRVVSVDRLISELWGETPPDSATSTLQVYISRLRRSLRDVPGEDLTNAPPVRIRLRPPGYLLELPDGALDVWRLTRAVEAARAEVTSDPQGALVLLDQGLSLVTGEPMVDVVDALGPVATAEAQRLSELVLQAQEARLEALLGVGRASEAAAAAAHLVHDHPLRESLHALQLLALYRSGRQTEALAAYQVLRERLAEDLGVDPGPALRRLHAQLLQQDSSLDFRPSLTPDDPPKSRAPLAGVSVQDSPGGHDLLGRERELSLLEQAVRRIAEGHGGVWVLSGEAGIGKTRLAQEVTRRARAAGVVVAEGRAQETSDKAPYWPWGQILRNLPAVPRDGPAGVILGAESAGDGSGLTQPALHEAVVDLLVAEGRSSGPLLLLLEDLHWADEASLSLLTVLTERAAADPVMVVCTYRVEDAEPSGAFAAWLARLARAPRTERLRLTGLTDEQARELLTDRLGWEPDARTAAAAADRTAGNPFYLGELARLVRESDDASRAWGQVPGTVHDVLVHRLSRLPDESRRLLDVAAVVGRDCELGLLEAASGLTADQVDSGLAAAVSSGLVTEIAAPLPVLHFRHALIREALYAQLGARARMRLHASVGAAMAGRPEVDVDDLAAQLLSGGDLVDPEAAVSAALVAVDRAMIQLVFDHAQDLVDRAMPRLDRLPAGAERDGLELALQIRHGTIVATRYGFAAPAAREALERALELALGVEPGPDVYAAVYRRYLWLLMGGDFPAVEELADDLLYHSARADLAETRERFELLGRLARGSVLWCLGEAEAAVAELLQALRLVDGAGVGLSVVAFGDPAVRIRMFLCHALASAGRRGDALRVADEMVRQAQLSGPGDESDALATRGMMFAAFDEPEGARADGIEGRRVGRLAGANLLEHFAALNESWGAARLGGAAGSGAVEMARAAVDGYRSTGTRMHDPIVYTMLAETEAATGHPDRAEAAANLGLDALERTGSRLWRDRLLEVLTDDGAEGLRLA